ncbi:MAG TPA: methyltransferase domain-containing protein [Polyangiales bacterium]
MNPFSASSTWDLVADTYEDEIVPAFRTFAGELLDRVPPGARAIDVAAGPGTLSFLAAARGASVDAIDFSPRMIEQLRARLRAEPTTIVPWVGDGMALPYADASFDAGYSQFGLMFFPDRARGLHELRRVLKPGARAAITSWAPLAHNAVLSEVVGWLRELLEAVGQPPAPAATPPMSSHDLCRAELRDTGFREVEVHDLCAPAQFADGPTMIASFVRSSPLFALTKSQLGARFEAVHEELTRRASTRFGTQPVRMEMPAYLTIGAR